MIEIGKLLSSSYSIYAMGCMSSKSASQANHEYQTHHERDRTDERQIGIDKDTQMKESTKSSRVRRLSQTVFEAENVTSEEPITISVPVPVPIGLEADKPVRRRKERRSSYIQFETDPRSVVVAVASACVAGAESGNRKRNQDAVLIHMDDHACLFAVFDGHGHQGHHCSNYLKTSLPAMAKMKLLEDVSTGETLASALLDAEKGMNKAQFDCSLSGSTATVVMVQSSRIVVSWVGDSPCFMISARKGRDQKASENNVDPYQSCHSELFCTTLAPAHNFQKNGERERVLAAGGRVMHWQEDGEFVGPLRVFMSDRAMPGLNMSRSLGDTLAHKIGVSSQPEAITRELDNDDKYLILGSDGLTEFLSNEEIQCFVSANEDLQKACDESVSEARKRWIQNEEATIDDISIIILKLRVLPVNIEAI